MSARRGTLGETLAVFVAAGAALLGLWLGCQQWPDATTHLRDDAFYEFTWAWNLAHGNGPVVSDGVTTSGVQYLWSLLLVPFALGDGSRLPDVAIALGGGLHLLGALSWLVAGRWRAPAWCAALLWLGNPLLLRECQNGQETALACLFAALLWHVRRAPERTFGAVALLAVLARSDLFAAVLLLSLVRHGRRWPRGLPVPLSVLAVHLLLNRWLGGGFLQDSALPMSWLFHANFAATAPTAGEWLHQAYWYLRPALVGAPFALTAAAGWGAGVFAVLRPLWPRALRAVPLLATALATLWAGDLAVPAVASLLLLQWPARRRRRPPLQLLALLLGLSAIVALHWAVRWYPRDYYAAPLVAGGTAALLHFRKVPLLWVAAALLQAYAALHLPREPLQGQATMELAGGFLAQVAPPGQRVGCFNSGIVTFAQRGAGVRLLNLDGVVDARALRALQQQRLSAWLDEQQVLLLLDNWLQFGLDPKVPHACGRWFGADFEPAKDLVELARFVTVADGGAADQAGAPWCLYWRGPSPPPMAEGAAHLGRFRGGHALRWRSQPGATLEVEQPDGTRLALVRATLATTYVLALPRRRLGTGRLFEQGGTTPILALPAAP